MRAVLTVAGKEIQDGIRNRWIVAATSLLAGLALALAFLGSAPTGTVGVSGMTVMVVSLASLTIFFIPLIALLLSFDAIVGERERGSLILLLSYPLSRGQILAGKFVGHIFILAAATILGYGAAGIAIALLGDGVDARAWGAFGALIGSSVLLGGVFLAVGYLISIVVRERATAAGLAVATWLVFVLLYDLALLGWLVADQGKHLSAQAFQILLLFNPADVYRMFNLTGVPEVRQFSGMAGIADETAFSPALLLTVLVLWLVVPLAAARALFGRKEL